MNLKDKLIRVERTVNIYLKNGDELIKEINVDFIPFDKLSEIVTPRKDDPLLYDGYELNEKQIEAINSFRNKIVDPDFSQYYYILEAYGIYDWDKK